MTRTNSCLTSVTTVTFRSPWQRARRRQCIGAAVIDDNDDDDESCSLEKETRDGTASVTI